MNQAGNIPDYYDTGHEPWYNTALDGWYASRWDTDPIPYATHETD